MNNLDIEAAIANPSNFFEHPDQVIQSDISKADKIKILQSWEYDLRDIAVAEEENMAPGRHNDADLLSHIHQILDKLDALDDSGDTKQ